jgi:hypothetical protein
VDDALAVRHVERAGDLERVGERQWSVSEAGFTLKAAGEADGADLEGNGAVEASVAGFLDVAHSAGANGSDDFVGSQPGLCGQRHRQHIPELLRGSWGISGGTDR